MLCWRSLGLLCGNLQCLATPHLLVIPGEMPTRVQRRCSLKSARAEGTIPHGCRSLYSRWPSWDLAPGAQRCAGGRRPSLLVPLRGTLRTPAAWDTEGSFSSRREDIYKNSRMGADFEGRVEIPGIPLDCVLLAKILCSRERVALSGYSCTAVALGEVPSLAGLRVVVVGGGSRCGFQQDAPSLGRGA